MNGGSRAVRSVCAVGSAIYAIRYDIASPNGPPDHVHNVIVRCVMLPYFNANVDVDLDGQAGAHSSVLNFCGLKDKTGKVVDNGTIAKGLVIGLDGINITSLSPECDTVNNIAGLVPTPVYAPAPGGTGGPPSDPPGSMHGRDLPGYDYHSYPTADPFNCKGTCESDARCRAWTWAEAGTNGVPTDTCYLKNVVPPGNPNACCISGISTTGGGGKPIIKLKPGSKILQQIIGLPAAPAGGSAAVDMPGNDYRASRLPIRRIASRPAWAIDSARHGPGRNRAPTAPAPRSAT